MSAANNDPELIEEEEAAPLPFLISKSLELMPQAMRPHLLDPFVGATGIASGDELAIVELYDEIGAIGDLLPALALESSQARIILVIIDIERISLDLFYHLLFSLGLWQAVSEPPKSLFLFFLTKWDLVTQWRPDERDDVFTSIDSLQSLSDYLILQGMPRKIGHSYPFPHLHGAAKDIAESVRFGCATWQVWGNNLHQLADSLAETELRSWLTDFLDELHHRKLWRPGR